MFGIITEVTGKEYYKVEANAYAKHVGWDYRYFWSSSFKSVLIDHVDGAVILKTENELIPWKLCAPSEMVDGALVLGAVLGVTPNDNDHLAVLMADLKG